MKNLLLPLFLLAGCASIESGRDFGPADFAWIESGTTTKAEVVARCGAPNYVHQTADGEVMIWAHSETNASAMNASILNPFSTKVDTDVMQETARVYLTKAGIVTSWDYSGPDTE